MFVEYRGHRSKVKVTWVFRVFPACVILLEPVGLDSRNVTTSFAKWRHFITGRGCNWRYPRSVLSLEQGLMILFSLNLLCTSVRRCSSAGQQSS